MRGVTRVYGVGGYQVKAVDGVDLTVAPGEFLAIMGPSGSGKSTLMHIIGCLDRPSSGSYRLEGLDVSSLNEDQLAAVRRLRLGFVFQTFNLLPRLTALQNVELPMVYAGVNRKERRARALELLGAVGLSGRTDHHPNQMSGGERQRVAIARSLVNEPALLLADEPTGNLDSRSGDEVVEIITGLHAGGRTIVLITHEASVAARAQRIVHMHDGRLLDGPPPAGGYAAGMESPEGADAQRAEAAAGAAAQRGPAPEAAEARMQAVAEPPAEATVEPTG